MEEKKSIFKKWLVLTIILFIVGMFIIVGSIDSSSTVTPQLPADTQALFKEKNPEKDNKPDLELLDTKVENEGFINYITGTIRNNANRKYSYVQVEINLYDKDGAQIGSTLANANNLEAGGLWKFKAMYIEEGVESYKIIDITKF